MLEVKGNMWKMEANAHLITTNGYVKKNGEGVMGRGCAKEAATLWPDLPKLLGDHLTREAGSCTWCPRHFKQKDTNHIHCLKMSVSQSHSYARSIWTFPVKWKWDQEADIKLIKRSAQQLQWLLKRDRYPLRYVNKVILPRPGCGNGRLAWEEVKPVIEPYLDDRVWVVSF